MCILLFASIKVQQDALVKGAQHVIVVVSAKLDGFPAHVTDQYPCAVELLYREI